MLESIEGLQVVMSQSAHYLLTSAKTNYKPNNGERKEEEETIFFDLDDKRDHHYAIPKQRTIGGLRDPYFGWQTIGTKAGNLSHSSQIFGLNSSLA